MWVSSLCGRKIGHCVRDHIRRRGGREASSSFTSKTFHPPSSRCTERTSRRNPFEIEFEDDVPQSLTSHDYGTMDIEPIGDELDFLHREMAGVFGGEPQEYDDGGNSVVSGQSTSFKDISKRDGLHSFPTPSFRPKTNVENASHGRISNSNEQLMLIHGSCTFVQHQWIGSTEPMNAAQVHATVEQHAIKLLTTIQSYHSNHEGQVLDWLLTAPPNSKIILNWNGRLIDSPSIFRALSVIDASVILVAPLDVEVGQLPTTVKGVITGCGCRSLELAMRALM